MDLRKPFEQMTPHELQEAISSGLLSKEAKRRAQGMLDERAPEMRRIIRLQEEARTRKKGRLEKQEARYRGMNENSVKNSTKNGLGFGTLAVIASGIDQAIEVYDKLDERKLLPGNLFNTAVAVMRQMHFSDKMNAYIIAAFIIGFVLTMGVKIIQHYERGGSNEP